MSKLKVGDKVRVVRVRDESTYWCAYKEGDIHEITYAYGGGDFEVGWQRMHPNDIEPIHQNTLQVGQTYTSENGDKWECIFVRNGKAWMAGVFDGVVEGSAYMFNIDGTNISQGGGTYNIKWGPKRETVTRAIDYVDGGFFNGDHNVSGEELSITFDIIDGKPDWTKAKVTPCDQSAHTSQSACLRWQVG